MKKVFALRILPFFLAGCAAIVAANQPIVPYGKIDDLKTDLNNCQPYELVGNERCKVQSSGFRCLVLVPKSDGLGASRQTAFNEGCVQELRRDKPYLE